MVTFLHRDNFDLTFPCKSAVDDSGSFLSTRRTFKFKYHDFSIFLGGNCIFINLAYPLNKKMKRDK